MEGILLRVKLKQLRPKQNIRFQNNASANVRKFHYAGSASMVNTSFTIQEEVPFTSDSELVPLIKITNLEHYDDDDFDDNNDNDDDEKLISKG